MPVRRLRLKDFSAFASADLEFVDGLNVFLGVNGTGKTHLLKLVYALLEATRTGAPLGDKLAGVFRPDDNHLGRLVRRVQHARPLRARYGTDHARVELWIDPQQLGFELASKTGRLKEKLAGDPHRERGIFLPSREVLAMYEGFIAAYRERELAFDETYFDACVALNANPIKAPGRAQVEPVLQTLRAAIGGQVELGGERFYVKFQGDKARMEAHLVAEGLRKLASLERLLLNGSLAANGYLFWDEPEANLNPRLTAVVADVLGALARLGIQVFLTTHDFLLARRLSVKSESPGEPATRFFACFRPEAGAPVEVRHGAQLADLPENPIEEAFAHHYDFEIGRRFGDAS